MLFKEIPQEIPQQPTNWSRQALEARELAERYACEYCTTSSISQDRCWAGTPLLFPALCLWLAVMDGDVEP